MAKLKIVLVDGAEHEIQITPRLEWAFENYAKKGFYKAITEDQMNTHLYWLAYEGLRTSGLDISLPGSFGDKFLDMLKKVDVLDDDPLL